MTCYDRAIATTTHPAPHTRLLQPPKLEFRDFTHLTMIQSTRRWLRRNRTNFAIGAGVLGAGYVAGQYVLGKLSEARQRMSDERIAKEKYAGSSHEVKRWLT